MLGKKKSSDQCTWYLAKILSVQPDGTASLKYRKDNTIEDVYLNEIRWTTVVGVNGTSIHRILHQKQTNIPTP